ncbi:NADP-dependent phosphogluconate dehydrogenase [cyanobiont of Ornithocercus magnificus]|nr:NADP-dependent phosphogluconate dehydrogenase [cyanobiont of Ornithocercus magnificus]
MTMPKAHFGLIGLGVMGENLVLNAERNGFSSVVYNRTYAKTEIFLSNLGTDNRRIEGAHNLQELVEKLERPRRILIMVKAGPAVDTVIEQISPLIEEGDLLIDGGNSEFHDTERRVAQLEGKSFGFIGMGVSGGAKGALEGPSMMPGGTRTSYKAIESLVRKMAAQAEDGPCVTYIGPGGAGHFVKTVHNGIEYSMQQILAEAYDLMKRVANMSCGEIADVFSYWNSIEELSSYLVEISEVCLRTKDPETGDSLVEKIMDQAAQKGTGLWTVVSALQMGVSMPTIYAAVNARLMSSMYQQRQQAKNILHSPLGKPFSVGTLANGMAPLMDAVVLGYIASYAQGMELLRVASEKQKYGLQLHSIARIWKGGCIIRAHLLKRIQNAFTTDPHLCNLLVEPWFAEQVSRRLAGLTTIVAGAANSGIPVPCLSSTLDYINSYKTGRLPQNLIQAMRDCFGSHTYQRIDKEGIFHTEWLK